MRRTASRFPRGLPVAILLAGVLPGGGAADAGGPEGAPERPAIALDPAAALAKCRLEIEEFRTRAKAGTAAALAARVEEVGWKLAAVSDRPDFPYQFLTFGDETPQAFAFTDCAVGVTESLARLLDDDELAFVLGHELAHVVLRHPVTRWRDRRDRAEIPPEVIRARERDFQVEADRMGALYAVRAGYAYSGGQRVLERLEGLRDTAPEDPAHAEFAERARALREFRGNLELAVETFQAGVAHLDEGDFDEAIAVLQYFVAEFPNSVAGRVNLGTAHFLRLHREAGGPEGLSEILPPIIIRDPGVENLYRGLLDVADLYWAREHFERALEIDPEAVPARAGLGLVYTRLARLPEARAHLEELRRRGPDRPAAVLLCLGNVEFLDHRYGEAVARYRQALEMEPDLEEARRNLALTYAKLSRVAQASRNGRP